MKKLYEIYQKIIKDVTFKFEQQDEDRIKYSAISDGVIVGSITIQFVMGGYWEFDDEMGEDRYDEIFPDDKFAKIENLEVDNHYQRQGFAKLLLQKGIEYIKQMNETVIYLNASPYLELRYKWQV
jgi:ribosomal protein S18 acetylase RimI-like enzyme